MNELEQRKIPEYKNFFAMSLKEYLKNLSDDELELMCHYYVHRWK
jgi:hypothetical protein